MVEPHSTVKVLTLAYTAHTFSLNFVSPEALFCPLLAISDRALVNRQVFVGNLKICSRFNFGQGALQFLQFLLLKVR